MNKKAVKKGIIPYFGLGLFMIAVLFFMNMANNKINVLTYDQFMSEIEKNNVKEVLITPRSNASVYEISGTLKDYKESETFYLKAPISEGVMNKILDARENNDFKLDTESDPSSSTLLLFIVNILLRMLIYLKSYLKV